MVELHVWRKVTQVENHAALSFSILSLCYVSRFVTSLLFVVAAVLRTFLSIIEYRLQERITIT